ncbi:hypothetical protein G9A89_021791 [Geosiphon pyriformis]|nr:hypothetical protein G9A89_021791 [Geosiphon pyriformis]
MVIKYHKVHGRKSIIAFIVKGQFSRKTIGALKKWDSKPNKQKKFNSAIMDPILWHAKNIISEGNEEFNKYFWHWIGYLIRQPSKKPGTIPVLRPDAPRIVMAYLLSLDLSDWNPQDIPTTKMKVETMRERLPNPIRFIIDHIAPCGNGEKPLTSRVAGKKFSQIGIERKQVRINAGREWIYILDRSKIVSKLRPLSIPKP